MQLGTGQDSAFSRAHAALTCHIGDIYSGLSSPPHSACMFQPCNFPVVPFFKATAKLEWRESLFLWRRNLPQCSLCPFQARTQPFNTSEADRAQAC